MPKFSTTELHIKILEGTDFTDEEYPFQPLPKKSVDRLCEAIGYAMLLNVDVTVLGTCSGGKYLDAEDYAAIHLFLLEHDSVKAIITHLADLFVIRTKAGNIVTVRIYGFAKLTDEMKATVLNKTVSDTSKSNFDDDDDRFEAIGNVGFTQELQGLDNIEEMLGD